MEENKKSGWNESDKEIVFSQTIKAGKRIYYIDVKKNRKDDMYISITESKKLVSGEGENATVSFEKHKIFLYREDFAKFANSLNEAISYVVAEQGEYKPMYAEPENDNSDKLNIDIDFWHPTRIIIWQMPQTFANYKNKAYLCAAFKTSCDGELSRINLILI